MGESDPWAPGRNEDATTGRVRTARRARSRIGRLSEKLRDRDGAKASKRDPKHAQHHRGLFVRLSGVLRRSIYV